MDDVESIEEELRQRLHRVDAPDGFAERVMARVASRSTAPVDRQGRRGLLLHVTRHAAPWTAAAALLLVLGGGDALHMRHQRQAREAAAAQAEVDLAMQLTRHALNEVTTGLDRSPAGRFAQLWNGTER